MQEVTSEKHTYTWM